MRIKTTLNGYEIIASTPEDQSHLDWLVDKLQEELVEVTSEEDNQVSQLG